MDDPLQQLRSQFPWPLACPDVPEDVHGWLTSDTAQALTRRLDSGTRLVVECGSWLGTSARAILAAAPNAALVCCDHWLGSPNEREQAEIADRLPELYQTFLRNLWPDRDRVVPLRADSLAGLAAIHALGLVPDLFYLDTEHTYERLTSELDFCTAHWPGVPLVCDDYGCGPVRAAVQDHASRTGRSVVEEGWACSLE
jgi:hypothetical protein